ncbi:MAG: aspartate kinase [Candidatus Eisenbacteria bacterium]|uniref:Aspartokinase n=1 Tax=Eiseniibacteriota bacterium TaxID=2212470 RepID=A0A538TFU6_UNCEI|nr:MAG: aspartate kinase [Candidatus Eisenbacteria bacterium]
MSVIVQKYGGTSVAGPDRLRVVARRVAGARAAGADLVVVVSAMGQTTDDLLTLAHQVSARPSRRELDMLLTAGERVAMSLLAMALHDLGVEAISFTGSQSGILTDGAHSAARILEVKPDRIRAELARGRVVIVAGFQGVDPKTKEITTLGRGGSDTTAVAVAAALAPATCEIYTDVSGVFTADPRIVPDARGIDELGYSSCSVLAHLGGRVLHGRCVDLAARHRVPIVVRSSFDERPGTRIVEDPAMEGTRVLAVTHRGDCAIALAEGNPGGRGEARGVIEAVAEAVPGLELVAHEQEAGGHTAVVWVGSPADAATLEAEFRTLRGPGGEWKIAVEQGAAFVSVVGLGLGAPEVVRAEAALERARVPLVALRATPVALIFRVAAQHAEQAVRAVHGAFFPGEREGQAAGVSS